ncbi:MAG TPA: hypothetical protein DCM40_10070, partial [Maribacter sp.]|nr:hypothetical protein [Maribacter sp.]
MRKLQKAILRVNNVLSESRFRSVPASIGDMYKRGATWNRHIDMVFDSSIKSHSDQVHNYGSVSSPQEYIDKAVQIGGEHLRQPLTKALMTYQASKNIRLPTADAMADRPMMDMPGE